jgi:hypothetical protein
LIIGRVQQAAREEVGALHVLDGLVHAGVAEASFHLRPAEVLDAGVGQDRFAQRVAHPPRTGAKTAGDLGH